MIVRASRTAKKPTRMISGDICIVRLLFFQHVMITRWRWRAHGITLRRRWYHYRGAVDLASTTRGQECAWTATSQRGGHSYAADDGSVHPRDKRDSGARCSRSPYLDRTRAL